MPERIVPRRRHGEELSASLEQLAATVDATAVAEGDEDARVVLKIHASARLAPGPLSRLRLSTLGEGDDWTYFVLSTHESRSELAAVLSDYCQLPDGESKNVDWSHPKSWAKFVDQVEGIELFGPDDRADASLADLTFTPTALVDCLLWPASSAAIGSERVGEILRLVTDHSQGGHPAVHVEAVDTRPDRMMVRVAVDSELLGRLLESVEVERVRKPLEAAVTQSAMVAAVLPADLPGAASTLIGVVDGLLTASPLTEPFTADRREFPRGHVFSGPDEHGTAVASVAVWGSLDALVTGGAMPVPHPVVAARVLEPTNRGTNTVVGLAHVTIESAIRWMVAEHGVRIVNLSINHSTPATAPLRDELTVTIDELARELDLVVVVSAGNRLSDPPSHWLHGYPGYLSDAEAGIASPGDAALAVTVGSLAVRDVPGGRFASSRVAIAGVQEPSPFTRSGPVRGGVGAMLKPEFVAHGGNWCWDQSGNAVDSRDPGVSAIVAQPPTLGRLVGARTGTSYAAPAVAHEVARVAERYPDAGANLLRALTALAAPSRVAAAGPARYALGYGYPDASRVLESDTHRVFLTFQGEMPTNRVVVHRLPIPTAFAEGVRERSLRVALAFDPPVRRGRREYAAGGMTVELVRGLTLEEVAATYERQPTVAQVEADSSLVRLGLPRGSQRPDLEPGATAVAANTLIRREFIAGQWDPEHLDYFIVVTHNQSPWTNAQRAAYDVQSYALAVEVADEAGSAVDLYASMRALLRPRLRVRRR